MTYFEKLHPWCIVRSLPNLQHRIVARCRRRNDAESQVRILRQLMPTVPYEIVFDITPDDPSPTVPLSEAKPKA
jgi:hypothetical protein